MASFPWSCNKVTNSIIPHTMCCSSAALLRSGNEITATMFNTETGTDAQKYQAKASFQLMPVLFGFNLSIRQDKNCKPGELRHLGWEDSSATAFSGEVDVNGIVWKNFSAQQQADEINELWPEAKYQPID